jgi:flagellar hook-associated protein 3 FlgL
MRISNLTFTDGFLGEVNQLQQKEQTLQGEVSSGLSITLPGDNPQTMSQVLNLQSSASANTSYQNNITQLQDTATTAGSAMSSLQTILSNAAEIATNASNGTTSSTQLATYASTVSDYIQEALGLANTQDANGNYIFAGTASNTTPFTATTGAGGAVTAVTYNGNTSVAQSQIGPNTSISVIQPGANSTSSGEEGLFSDSRTGADVFNDLISLQQNLASGNTAAISSTNLPAINNDEDHVVSQISANGVTQQALTVANNIATAQNTDINTQISGETGANIAQTITELDQTQTAYEAALESGTMVMQVSLVNFLS